MDRKLVAKELLTIAKEISSISIGETERRYQTKNWIPMQIREILENLQEVAPYIFLINSFKDEKKQADILLQWAKKNGSPSSKLFRRPDGWFIKISDPLCSQLEQNGFIFDGR